MIFLNRQDAGKQLARALTPLKIQNPLVVALPRGGVPVGAEIAYALEAPLDILTVRKLGFPHNPETAIGSIVDGENWEVFLNEDFFGNLKNLDAAYLQHEVSKKLIEIRNMNRFLRGPQFVANSKKNKNIILIDDGVATGATMRLAIRHLRREEPQSIIVAAPVASREAAELIKREADQTVFLTVPKDFEAVGYFYENFAPVSTAEVKQLLEITNSNRTARFNLKVAV